MEVACPSGMTVLMVGAKLLDARRRRSRIFALGSQVADLDPGIQKKQRSALLHVGVHAHADVDVSVLLVRGRTSRDGKLRARIQFALDCGEISIV